MINQSNISYHQHEPFLKGVTFTVAFILIAVFSAQSVVGKTANINLVNSSSEVSNADTSKVYDTVDEMPQIVGGMQELYKNIKYPEKARISGVEGRVFLQFVLDQNGNINNPQVVRDIGGGCGEAAVEALKKVKFTPGRIQGEAVKVKYTLPVTFQLVN